MTIPKWLVATIAAAVVVVMIGLIVGRYSAFRVADGHMFIFDRLTGSGWFCGASFDWGCELAPQRSQSALNTKSQGVGQQHLPKDFVLDAPGGTSALSFNDLIPKGQTNSFHRFEAVQTAPTTPLDTSGLTPVTSPSSRSTHRSALATAIAGGLIVGAIGLVSFVARRFFGRTVSVRSATLIALLAIVVLTAGSAGLALLYEHFGRIP